MPSLAARREPLPDAGGAGAIAAAAEWCAALRGRAPDAALLAFGTPESALVLAGETRRLTLRRYRATHLTAEALWAELEAFSRRKGFVAGYVGFDAVWPDDTPRPSCAAPPTLHFWEPQGVVRIDAVGGTSPRSSLLKPGELLHDLRPAPLGPSAPVALRAFDAEPREFAESVALTIDSIRRGHGQRLTLGRRVELPPDIDLLDSFATPPAVTDHAVSRSFYARTGPLELAGHSPELLARGDATRFTCYKLSGTGPRHPDRSTDERLREALLADAKTREEHALSIEATRSALEAVGAVTAGRQRLLERPGLRHLLTPLEVAVRPGLPWSAILRAILPTGAQPRAAGLRALDRLERGGRGAWYGLIGLRWPDGRFEFSQVLRTLFRDGAGVHTFVGAAVTGGSTVEGESEETRLKLDDVVARRPAASGGRA